jgi:hypothetical protein
VDRDPVERLLPGPEDLDDILNAARLEQLRQTDPEAAAALSRNLRMGQMIGVNQARALEALQSELEAGVW